MLKHRLSMLTGVTVFLLSALITLSPAPDTVAGTGHEATRIQSSPADLNGLSRLEQTIDLQVQELPLEKLFQILTKYTGLEIRLEGDGTVPVTVDLSNRSLEDSLLWLQTNLGLEYKVTGSNSLAVLMPYSPEKDEVTHPSRISEIGKNPVYPEAARKEHIDGKVILQVVIRQDGTVSSPTILEQDVEGYGFAASAREAVLSWRYDPATLAGKPVAVWMNIRVNFKLDKNKKKDRSLI